MPPPRHEPATDKDVDLLQAVLCRVQQHLPALGAEALAQIEADIRAAHGGERARIAKRRPFLGAEQRSTVRAAALASPQASDREIAASHGISRATLYRLIKRAG